MTQSARSAVRLPNSIPNAANNGNAIRAGKPEHTGFATSHQTLRSLPSPVGASYTLQGAVHGPAVLSARAIQRSSEAGRESFKVNLQPRSGGWPLPREVQLKMEKILGANFSDVRVHVGNEAPSIGALAFTWGSNIHFAPGQYSPHTPQGQFLLGHELAHVVQQRAGRVRNPFGNGTAVVQDQALEAEADRFGRLAAAHTVQPKTVEFHPSLPTNSSSQVAKSLGIQRHVDKAANGYRLLPTAATRPSMDFSPKPATSPAASTTVQQNPWRRLLMRGAAAGYAGFVGRNVYNLHRTDQGTIRPEPHTRLNAYDVTRQDPGVNGNIGLIYMLLGGLGQARIGNVFRGQQAQNFVNAQGDGDADDQLANVEWNYWLDTFRTPFAYGMSAAPGRLFGGALGTMATPRIRAGLQRGMRLRIRNLQANPRYYDSEPGFGD